MSKAVKDTKRQATCPAGRAAREVAFILSSREAEEVYLCGDFNQWVSGQSGHDPARRRSLVGKAAGADARPLRIQVHREWSLDSQPRCP